VAQRLLDTERWVCQWSLISSFGEISLWFISNNGNGDSPLAANLFLAERNSSIGMHSSSSTAVCHMATEQSSAIRVIVPEIVRFLSNMTFKVIFLPGFLSLSYSLARFLCCVRRRKKSAGRLFQHFKAPLRTHLRHSFDLKRTHTTHALKSSQLKQKCVFGWRRLSPRLKQGAVRGPESTR